MFPKAVVFDLDYTLWPCWCDTHIRLPVRLDSGNCVIDAVGYYLQLYDGVESSIKKLKQQGVKIIAASRTARPDIAMKLLNLYEIDGKPMIGFFDSLQWGQGSKIHHVKRAVQELGLQAALKDGDILLFDDELRNQDVLRINCRFCYVGDSDTGLTGSFFDRQIEDWRKERQL